MTKAAAGSTLSVRNPKTGRYVTVKGAASLKGSKFSIKKGVDLTKPIATQVLGRGKRIPKRAAKG